MCIWRLFFISKLFDRFRAVPSDAQLEKCTGERCVRCSVAFRAGGVLVSRAFFDNLVELGWRDCALLHAAEAGIGLVPAHLEGVLVVKAAAALAAEEVQLPLDDLLLELLAFGGRDGFFTAHNLGRLCV